jgi:predicted neutral ceramidase superfamily lipid hydrolase
MFRGSRNFSESFESLVEGYRDKGEKQETQRPMGKEGKHDPAGNIARRYRHVFRLPSAGRSIAYSSIPVLTIAFLSRIIYYTPDLLVWAVTLTVAQGFYSLSAYIDTLVLRRASPVATFRRLAALNLISNSFWLLAAASTFLFFLLPGTSSSFVASRFSLAVILGMFFSTAFREVVIGALFVRRPISATFPAITQPAINLPAFLAAGPLAGVYELPNVESTLIAVVLGLILVASTTMYITYVNSSAGSSTAYPSAEYPTKKLKPSFVPFLLFQSFMMAWAENDPTALESSLEEQSKTTKVMTQILTLTTEGRNEGAGESVRLILPELHPGPFYPVGSSNLPYEVFTNLKTPTVIPVTLHGVSDHELNLPSRREVMSYVHSLKGRPMFIKKGNMSSGFISENFHKASVSGVAFGKTVALLTLTLSPHGMEDFPAYVRYEVLQAAKENGFEHAVIIDSHNSIGQKPNDRDCQDVIEAARRVLARLRVSEQHQLRVGFAHSSELPDVGAKKLGSDIGPAGVTTVLFSNNVTNISGALENNMVNSRPTEQLLVCVDGNNAIIGYRERVFEAFKNLTDTQRGDNIASKLDIIEVCTSDTHVTAAKALNIRGYIAVGESTSPSSMARVIELLTYRAQERLGDATFTFEVFEGELKTIGVKMLDDFSFLLDRSLSRAKKGAIVLLTLMIFCLGVVLAY